MQIDIKYGDNIISTIEEKEAQILATQDTFLTNNIIVDVVDGGGESITDATVTANDVIENATCYNNNGKISGLLPQRNDSSITIQDEFVQIPSGFYANTVTKSFPAGDPVVTLDKEKSGSTVLNVTPTILPNTIGAITPTTYSGIGTITCEEIVDQEFTTAMNGSYDITEYATAKVAFPVFMGEPLKVTIDSFCSGESKLQRLKVFIEGAVDVYPSCSSMSYTGSSVTTVITNYYEGLMTVSGTTSAIERGTYTCTFTLLPGFWFADSNLSSRDVTWQIS